MERKYDEGVSGSEQVNTLQENKFKEDKYSRKEKINGKRKPWNG